MKPNFALTLSLDGIGLLHRAFPGWHLVGEVGLDTSDLAGELAELRSKAIALDPSGLRSKLVLPNDQIKFLTLEDVDDSDELEPIVRDALDGATPYAVDDLAYDWTIKDGQLHIAAVARETLAEAEAFAFDHQFNPVCFVATPDADQFAGEPYFGITGWMRTEAGDDADIERDTVPIRVIGVSKLPDADAEASDDADETVSEPEDDPAASDSEDQPQSSPADNVEDAAELEAATEADEAEQDPKPDEDAEDDVSAEATAFSSIRTNGSEENVAPPRLEGVSRDNGRARITLGPALREDPPLESPATPVTGVSDATLPMDDADQPTVFETSRRVSDPPLKAVDDDHPSEISVPPAPPLPEGDEAAFFTRRSRKKSKAEAKAARIPVPSDEKQRMTVFGARDAAAVGGKPRFLGLILTAVLLLFLIGVAAWASIFMDEGLARFFRSDPVPAVADIPETDDVIAEEPAEDPEEIDLAALDPDEPLSVLEDPATEILSRVNPSDLSPDEAKARYAATGIWQLAPDPSVSPQPTNMEEFYQTSLDPEPGFQDAVALPAPTESQTDGMMFSPAAPPAADTQFVFDPRGFVLATPDGALSPDGVLVFAGQPSVLPPASRRQPGVETSDEPTAEDPAETPALAALRPRARPSDFAETIERNELSGRTRSELAALRPKLRPQSAQEAAEEARKQAEIAAQAEAQAAAAAAATDPDAVNEAVANAQQATLAFATATPQAVKTSIKPRPKPRNFDTIVKRTKRNQQRQQQQAQGEQSQGQAVAVRATQRVQPKIPSRASVSKRATQKNALKFKRVNLIGVYGTPTSRRALVRMSNGRYKKVKVGDRLDGGRVSAIGDSDLRYKKGGREVILKMPRG